VTEKDIELQAKTYMSRAIEAERKLGYGGRVSKEAYRRATDRTMAAIQDLVRTAARLK
jgi:hypothetical protein